MKSVYVLLTTMGLLASAPLAASAASFRYTITDIGPVSSVSALNDSGRVVGQNTVGYGHAFVWSAATGMTGLALNPNVNYGGDQGYATGINNSGTVIGETNNHYWGWSQGSIWNANGALTVPAGPPTGYPYYMTSAINDNGTIVAENWNFYGPPYSMYLYSTSTGYTTSLSGLGGSTLWGNAINNSNQIAGYSQISSGAYRACLWINNSPNNLGTLGGTNSFAYALNASGSVVGSSDVANGSHAFLWSSANGMTDLGVLSSAFNNSDAAGINNLGQVVGWSAVSSSANDAVLWNTDGSIVDLSTCVNMTGWRSLQDAVAINNNGQIAGYGAASDGTTHGFLLTPVVIPEPASLSLVGLGLLALASRHRRR